MRRVGALYLISFFVFAGDVMVGSLGQGGVRKSVIR